MSHETDQPGEPKTQREKFREAMQAVKDYLTAAREGKVDKTVPQKLIDKVNKHSGESNN